MASSPPPERLTKLQRDLVEAFFSREHRLYLTGGGALVGFSFGHRETEDLALFATPAVDLSDAARALDDAASATGATLPGGVTPAALLAFRDDLARDLRAKAFERAKKA